MADYRLYILDENSHIRRAIEIVAEDDSEAVTLARDSLDGAAAELWNLSRKVIVFSRQPRGPSGSSGSPDPGASA